MSSTSRSIKKKTQIAGRPLVTIGLPFRNPGVLIMEAVQSVFCQTFNDWELILLDDGSKDGSVDIVRRIADPRVRVVTDGKNLGLPTRLNQIIRLAQGEYIARMDADDLMHPKRLERQLSFFEQEERTDVVDTGAVILNQDRQPVGVRGLQSIEVPGPLDALRWGVVLHPSVMAKKSWYEKNQYNPAYPRAEDRELFLRTLKSSTFAHIPEPLLYYFFAGNVKLRAFLQSYKSERKVLFQYGPDLVGWPLTIVLWARSLAKSCAVPILTLLGQQDLVTRRAYEPIPPNVLQEAQKVLEQIRNQVVPGW
jgi:glycosyltransferase involved in cell wall biosynthesis